MKDDKWFPKSEGDNDLLGNIHQRTEELYRVFNREVEETGTFFTPAFILRDVLVFPRMISPIFLSDSATTLAIEAAQEQNQTVIALSLGDEDQEDTSQNDFLPIGMELAAGRILAMQGGNHSALVQGRRRVEIVSILQEEPYLIVEARPVPDEFKKTQRLTALIRTSRQLFENCVDLNESLPEEAHLFSLNIEDPGWLADLIATSLSLPNETRKELLVLVHPADRLRKVNKIMAQELEVLELKDEIQAQVQTEVDRTQREYYLREQMRAIQSELGEEDIWSQEISGLNEKVENEDLPEGVKLQATRELQRLRQMPPMVPEVGIIRTYLD